MTSGVMRNITGYVQRFLLSIFKSALGATFGSAFGEGLGASFVAAFAAAFADDLASALASAFASALASAFAMARTPAMRSVTSRSKLSSRLSVSMWPASFSRMEKPCRALRNDRAACTLSFRPSENPLKVSASTFTTFSTDAVNSGSSALGIRSVASYRPGWFLTN